MKFLMKYVGGSQLYGLNTPESDVDWRGVYLNTDPEKILRFTVDESISTTGGDDGKDDEVYFELWRYFDILRKTNTQAVESLFVSRDKFTVLDPIMDQIIDNPSQFINSAKLVASTKGYSYGEYRLAMGERTGRLGGSRKAQLDKYGFSPKNVCQMIRLSRGLQFFQDTGVFPLDLKDHLPEVWELAYEVKTQPSNFTVDQIDKICLECLDQVNKVEDQLGWTFDTNTAVDIMRSVYKEYL
jgi:hypothetical protein